MIPKRAQLALLILILVAAASLRLFHLGKADFWAD